MVERSLFAIVDFWFVTRSKIYPFILSMACGGMIFAEKNSNFRKKNFIFIFLTFNFLMLLLLHETLKGSRNIQGFALIRAVLFVVLVSFSCCSDFRNESNGMFVLGWFFFFRQISIFQTAIFDRVFLYHSKNIVILSWNLKRYFAYDHFS